MNVSEAILSRGADCDAAILYRTACLTYGELRRRVRQVACGLLARNCRKGERVGILSENNPFFVIAYLAVIRAGLTAVPLQTEVTRSAFTQIISTTGIQNLFVSNRFLNRTRPWAEEMGLAILSEGFIEEPSEGATSSFPNIDDARDLAALMFTSGSTGAPKGVMVTHRNIHCNTLDIIQYVGLRSDDRVMVVLPFHYCFGLSLLHTHLAAGASLVLNNDFKLFPEAVLQDMQQKECTGLAGVPSTYQILLRKSRFRTLAFPHLRWFQQAGGKLPNICIQEILGAFPEVKYYLMYGQTEATARLSYLPPERLADKLGSIGKGLPSTKLEVLKPDGTPVTSGSDEVGEIVASGDNIARGYWNDPTESAKFFQNGRLRTGDIARVDSDGFIFILERDRDMIKSGGNRISAKEIEDVIAEIPAVVEVAVLGTPHDLLGEAIKACIVPSPVSSLNAQEVEAHCRKRLPAFKAPEEVILLKALPHNSSGKILKPELKKMLEQRKVREFSEASPQPACTAV